MEHIDVAVIGGGVTGLASARAIAAGGAPVCVLERHPRPGMDTSTRNSGVIHAGIYYPAGTLKARLCVEGRDLLYAFCAQHGVPHVRSGKLIVAHDESEIPQLEALQRRGVENGVTGLLMVDRAFIVAREPVGSACTSCARPAARCGSDRRFTIRNGRTTTKATGCRSKRSSSRRGGCCATSR